MLSLNKHDSYENTYDVTHPVVIGSQGITWLEPARAQAQIITRADQCSKYVPCGDGPDKEKSGSENTFEQWWNSTGRYFRHLYTLPW